MTLPLFSYPVKIVWVDDDELFLNSISLLLRNDYQLETYTTSINCLESFKNYTPPLSTLNFLRGEKEADNYELITHMPVDLNIKAFKNIRALQNRSEEITVLIADYSMPDMNGLQLFRELQDLPIKKIMITGAADHQLAVEAFNEGLIDYFIPKNSPSIDVDIRTHVKRLSEQYMTDQTNALLHHLEADYKLHLSDNEFVRFFNDWCCKNNISEYYTIDKQGNILLIDKNFNQSYFIVHSDRTLNNFIKSYENEAEFNSYIQKIKRREEIPFFGDGGESWNYEVSEWSKCFYTCQVIKGSENYYWAVAN